MKRKPILWGLGMLVLVLSLTACANSSSDNNLSPAGGNSSSSEPSPAAAAATLSAQNVLSLDEIRAKAMDAIGNINSYSFAMTLDMNLSEQNGKFINQVSDISGSMDKINKKMRLRMTLTQQFESSQAKEVKSSAEIYIDGDNMWVKTDGAGMSKDWQKQATPAALWEKQDIINQQKKLLETAGMSLSGLDKVKDTDCYLLDISPDIEALWESVKSQIGYQSASGGPQGIDPGEIVQDMAVKAWIARDTFLPLKIQEALTLTLRPEDLGVQVTSGNSAMTMKIILDLTASDYNRPVSLEPPDGLKV
jgi:RNA binding exosome subunit